MIINETPCLIVEFHKSNIKYGAANVSFWAASVIHGIP